MNVSEHCCLSIPVIAKQLTTFVLCYVPVVITQLKMDRGLALQDLITGTYEVLETVELPNQARVYLLDQLGLCEYVDLPLLCAFPMLL
jgi:hypothetical protein